MGRGCIFLRPPLCLFVISDRYFVCRHDHIHVFFYFYILSQIKIFTFCTQKQLSNFNVYITFRRGKAMTNERTDLIYMLDNCYEPIT